MYTRPWWIYTVPCLVLWYGNEYDHAYLSCHFCPITINLFKIRHFCIIRYCRYWWCLWVSKKETILGLFVKYGWGAQVIHRAFGCTVCIWRPHCNKTIAILITNLTCTHYSTDQWNHYMSWKNCLDNNGEGKMWKTTTTRRNLYFLTVFSLLKVPAIPKKHIISAYYLNQRQLFFQFCPVKIIGSQLNKHQTYCNRAQSCTEKGI